MTHTPYQQQIIKRYYNNRDQIMTQKLSELTTELYLAEGKKRQQVWKRITTALSQLGVEPEKIERLVNTDNPAQLAEFLKKFE
jgi:mannitol/fructose-specific phosphotransferase system IIA component (Ntr-type)